MDVASVEMGAFPIDSVFPKPDLEGADIFSVLMASLLSGGSGLQSAENMAQANGARDAEGFPVKATQPENFISEVDTAKDAGIVTAEQGISMPVSMPVPSFENPVAAENAGRWDAVTVTLPVQQDQVQVASLPFADAVLASEAGSKPPWGDMAVVGAGYGADNPDELMPPQVIAEVADDARPDVMRGRQVMPEWAPDFKSTPVTGADGDPGYAAFLSSQKVDEGPLPYVPDIEGTAGDAKIGPSAVPESEAMEIGAEASLKETAKELEFADPLPGPVHAYEQGIISADVIQASVRPAVRSGGEAHLRQVSQGVRVEPDSLISQISGRIKMDIKGEGGEVKMELFPESLGYVRVEVRVEGGAVRANILAENRMVKDAIDSNLQSLKGSLEGHGLKIDHLSVGVDQRREGGYFSEFNGRQGFEGKENPYRQRNEDAPKERRYVPYPQHEEGVSIFA